MNVSWNEYGKNNIENFEETGELFKVNKWKQFTNKNIMLVGNGIWWSIQFCPTKKGNVQCQGLHWWQVSVLFGWVCGRLDWHNSIFSWYISSFHIIYVQFVLFKVFSRVTTSKMEVLQGNLGEKHCILFSRLRLIFWKDGDVHST